MSIPNALQAFQPYFVCQVKICITLWGLPNQLLHEIASEKVLNTCCPLFFSLLLPSVHRIIKVYHYSWTTCGCCLGHFPNFLPQRWDGCDGVFQNKFLSSTRHAETMHSSHPPIFFWWLKFKLLDCGFCRGMALHSPASPLAPNSI